MLVLTPSRASSSSAAMSASMACSRWRRERRVWPASDRNRRDLLPAASAFSKRRPRRGNVELARRRRSRAGNRSPDLRRRRGIRWRGRRGTRLRQRQAEAGGDIELQAHEVEAGDHLGDGMLDLKPRVHFQEEESSVRAEDELHRADVAVTRRARRGARPRRRFGHAARARLAAGASSTIFWKRRCTEHSRSKRWIARPSPSPATCTSMWRGRST